MIAAVFVGMILPICFYFAGFVLPFEDIDHHDSKDGRSLSFGDRYANGFLLISAMMSLSVLICKITGCSLDGTVRALILETGVLLSLGIMAFYRMIRRSEGSLKPEGKLLPQEIAFCALGFMIIVISTVLHSDKLLSKDVLRSRTDLFGNTITGTDPETGREVATYSAVWAPSGAPCR